MLEKIRTVKSNASRLSSVWCLWVIATNLHVIHTFGKRMTKNNEKTKQGKNKSRTIKMWAPVYSTKIYELCFPIFKCGIDQDNVWYHLSWCGMT